MPASETIDSGATGAPSTTRKPRNRRKTDCAPPSTAAKPPRRRAAPKAAVEPPPVEEAAVTPADTGTQVVEPDTTVVELESVGLAPGESDGAGAALEPAIHEDSAKTADTPIATPTPPAAGSPRRRPATPRTRRGWPARWTR